MEKKKKIWDIKNNGNIENWDENFERMQELKKINEDIIDGRLSEKVMRNESLKDKEYFYEKFEKIRENKEYYSAFVSLIHKSKKINISLNKYEYKDKLESLTKHLFSYFEFIEKNKIKFTGLKGVFLKNYINNLKNIIDFSNFIKELEDNDFIENNNISSILVRV